MNRREEIKERLRNKLKQKQAALADEFDYLIFYIIYFQNDQIPKVFQAERVGLSMTNNQYQAIMQGVKSNAYSEEEAINLINRDTVQIHAARWFSLDSQEFGEIKNIHLPIWPSEVSRIECLCFSRWQQDSDQQPYKLLNTRFVIHQEYEISRNIIPFLSKAVRNPSKKSEKGGILFNKAQNFGLWVDPKPENHFEFILSSTLVCLAQTDLTTWNPLNITIPRYTGNTREEVLQILEWSDRKDPIPMNTIFPKLNGNIDSDTKKQNNISDNSPLEQPS